MLLGNLTYYVTKNAKKLALYRNILYAFAKRFAAAVSVDPGSRTSFTAFVWNAGGYNGYADIGSPPFVRILNDSVTSIRLCRPREANGYPAGYVSIPARPKPAVTC